MKNQILPLFTFCLLIFSCGEKSESSSESLEWELEIVDSISIQTMESIRLLAKHPDQNLFLFAINKNDSPILLINSEGKIVHTLDIPRDAPTAFGGVSSGATFFGDTIVIQGPRGLFFYDKELNFIKNTLRPYSTNGMIINGASHLHLAPTFKGKSMISFSGSPQSELPSITRDFYDAYNTFDLITVETGEFAPILPFHPSSKYQKSGDAFSYIWSDFSVKGSKLSYVFREDTVIFDVDLLDPKLEISATPIPFDHFLVKPGHEFNEREDLHAPSPIWGNILGIHKLDEIDIIIYSSGLEMENFPSETLPRSEFFAELSRKNPTKWIVRNSDNQFSKTKVLSKKYYWSLTDQQNNIWALQNQSSLDHEPDHQTLYQLKLVQK